MMVVMMKKLLTRSPCSLLPLFELLLVVRLAQRHTWRAQLTTPPARRTVIVRVTRIVVLNQRTRPIHAQIRACIKRCCACSVQPHVAYANHAGEAAKLRSIPFQHLLGQNIDS
jgi:hypothetical protein